MTPLTILILVGGGLHFGILFASAAVPRVLDWRADLAKLHPLTRQLVWVHGGFIVLTIVWLGVLCVTAAPDLAGGTPLARGVCGFVAVFWLARLALQFALFDPGPLLRTAWLKAGYHGLTIVFAYLAAVFGWAALAPAA